jgi:Fe-S-cluster containining protein
MSPDAPQQAETVTARVRLGGENWELQTSLSVPAGPVGLRTLLPLVQSFADAVVGAAAEAEEAQGRRVSCKMGCGACCRQLVPISEAEARHVAALVQALPEPRRSQVHARFAEARRRLEEAGLLGKLLRPEGWQEGDRRAVGTEYFGLGIACPFLEDESCSVYADRPIACREYLVTSPAESCARPSADSVRCVPLPLKVSGALYRMNPVPPTARFVRWVPLILALEWAEAHPDEPPPRPGPELLREFFGHLTRREAAGAAPPAPAPDTARGDG